MAFEDEGTGDHGGQGFEREPESDTFRPPPHPDDRLWRHPSEFRTFGGSRAGATAPSHRAKNRSRRSAARTSWVLVTVATAVGAVAAAGLSRMVGAHERIVDRPVTERVAVSPDGSSPLTGLGDGEPTVLTDSVMPATVEVGGPDGIGSGMVRRDDGIVLTSASDLGSGPDDDRQEQTVPVTLTDGSQVMGEIVGIDPVTDVAVLRLPAGHYPTVALSEVGRSKRGASVIVVSSEADGDVELTEGVVTSSVWRLRRVELPTLHGLLQIGTSSSSDPESRKMPDPIPPGGPVVDEHGAVVGMTTSSAAGWAYAVPIDVVTKVADDILTTGRARHVWLGFHGRDTQVAAAGVVVADVTPDGPVGSHLDSNDVIVALDGVPIPNMAALKAALLLYSPGDEVTVTYHRPGHASPETVEVALDERPADGRGQEDGGS